MAGFTIRDLYESDDPDYLAFVAEVVKLTGDQREDIAHQQEQSMRASGT